jgi:2,5-diketo-D-gluconate reductase A
MDIPRIALNDGSSIPQVGLGVYRVPPPETAAVVLAALELGYRHIDTAPGYDNELEVGEAIRASGVDRAELFVTTKLRDAAHRPDDARRAVERSLTNLGVGRADLLLIHHPEPRAAQVDLETTWGGLEALRREGLARSIGVANCTARHLERLARASDTVPAVSQVEMNPWYPNEGMRRYHRAHGIVTEGWGPLGQGAVMKDARLARIAADVGRTPAQVVLRWHLQRGDVVIPKTVSPGRLRENLGVFDWVLDDADMARVSALHSSTRRALRAVRARAITTVSTLRARIARS